MAFYRKPLILAGLALTFPIAAFSPLLAETEQSVELGSLTLVALEELAASGDMKVQSEIGI